MEIKLTAVFFDFRKKHLLNIMKIYVLLYCLTAFSLTPRTILSQNAEITIGANKTLTVDEVFDLIMAQTDYKFVYQEGIFNSYPKIKVKKGTIKANKLLEKSLSGGDFVFELSKNNAIVIKESPINKGQQQAVTGKITNENGDPLPGVTVVIKGTNKGTNTDFDGNYSIRATIGDILVFSFVGYQRKEVSVTDTDLNVILIEDIASLEEVVIVGYGTEQRKNLTGSVVSVSPAEINQSKPVTFDNALVGKAPGVYVVPSSGAPGSTAAIRIRGITSVFGNNEPLYVIDGIPIEIGQGEGNDFYSQNYSSTLSPLASINPQDIESIDILKDASATAIYGSRGANGVVMINTKKGSYSSVPSISFSVNTSISQFTNEYNVLNSSQFHDVIERAYNNADRPLPNDDELYPYGRDVNTDWQDVTSQEAISTNYYLNLNGGSLTGSTLYSLSASKTDQKGAIDFTKYQRNNIRSKIETQVSDKLRVGINFNYTDARNKGSNTTFYYQTIQYRPDIPIYDDEGNFGHDTGGFQANPYAKVRYPSYVDNETLSVSLFGEYEIIEGLMFKSFYSYNTTRNKGFRYTPSYDPFEMRNNRKGTLNQSKSKYSSRIFDNTLTLNKTIDKHQLNSVAGISYTQNKTDSETIRATDFPDDDVTVTPGAASSLNLSSGGTISGLSSYFLRANYNFDEKYYLTFTGRADKSTKFGPKNRWGYFPSGAVAWRISKESFLEDVKVINELKLRASYGKTGSANFSDFQYATFFAPGSFYNNNNGVISNTIPNPDIKWETTDQLDIAIEYSLLDRRLNGTIGYFDKKTSDQILLRDVTLETGGSSQFANIGDFQNKGFEFHIGYDVISNEKFQWTTDFNLSTIESKVLKLNGGYYRSLREGESLSYFSGYQVDGIFQSQSEIDALDNASPNNVYQSSNTAPGDFKYVDVNGDGFIGGDDNTIIGKAEPDFYGGWNNIFRYGNFEVSALFNFSKGNSLFNANKRDLTIFNSYRYNYSTDILNAWTPQNTDSKYPRLVVNDPNYNQRDSDYFIEDASFFRLKNLYVAYKFNPELLEKLFIKRATISFSASNLFTITSYSGLDPEVNYSPANNFNQGYDSAAYPPVKTFILGINLNI